MNPEPKAPEKEEARRGGAQMGSVAHATTAGRWGIAPNGAQKGKVGK